MGRIACLKDHFTLAGGYDEEFERAGYQDLDFIRRLELGFGLKVVHQPMKWNRLHVLIQRLRLGPFLNSLVMPAIPNSKMETLGNKALLKKDYQEMNARNLERSIRNIVNRQFVANTNRQPRKSDSYIIALQADLPPKLILGLPTPAPKTVLGSTEI